MIRLVVPLVVAGMMIVSMGTAVAGTASESAPGSRTKCEQVEVSGSLPVRGDGTVTEQVFTVGSDCVVRPGRVRYRTAPAVRRAEGSHSVKSFSEWFDCCNIMMNGLYSTSDWSTGNGQVLSGNSSASERHNNVGGSGWNLVTKTTTGGCAGSCASSVYRHHAEFSYKGFFDPSGTKYYNVHDTDVTLKGDGTASCEFSTETRNTFAGWQFVKSCA